MVKRLVLFFAAVASTLFGQNAELSGLVKDPAGAAVPLASIEVRNQDTGIRQATTTNNDGLYSVAGLKPGNYLATVQANGFKTLTRDGIVLQVEEHARLDLSLELGSVEEKVTVTGGAPLIDTTSAAVATVVNQQFVENIPLNGRSFQSLIALTPGVVSAPGGWVGGKGEFSVNGQRTEANYYTVDGVSANTGSNVYEGIGPGGFSGNVPSQTTLGTTQSLVSLDALQEFRIQTSTYSAQYGRTPGAQISFVTRSGTNDWHGSAFDYLRNGVFDANNWFNNFKGLPKTSERQNDFGGTLGGPVTIPRLYRGHDKTFFFFSYEGLRVSSPQPAQTFLVPDLALRQSAPTILQRYLNAFPLPNGPDNNDGSAEFTAAYSTPGQVDATSIRIDHMFNSKVMVFGRYSDSPSQTTIRGPYGFSPNSIQNQSNTVRSLTLGATALLTPRLTNELRFNSTWNDTHSLFSIDNIGGGGPFTIGDIQVPNAPHITNLFFGAFISGASWGYDISKQYTKQRQINIVETLNYTFNAHSFKLGADYRRLATSLFEGPLALGAQFFSPATVRQGLADWASTVVAPLPFEPIYNNLSLFVQDDWKVTPRLSLSLGLRWEANPPPSDAHGNLPYTINQITNIVTAVLAPKGTALWKTTYANFAPRLGAVYQLGRKPRRETVVRGGFGVFYDTGNAYASQGYGGVGLFTGATFSNVSFPLTAAQLSAAPPPSVATPYNSAVFGYDPHLKLPYTLQWNLAVEQALGESQTLTATYVGAAGRRLLWTRELQPGSLGNANFGPPGALSIGPGDLILTTNAAASDYDALQVQLKRRLSQGLQILASYTWSHSIDDTSTNLLSNQLLRASSDFDVRHNFQVAATYDIPGNYDNHFASAALRNWSLDGRLIGHSGLPFDVVGGTVYSTIGNLTQLRANLVPGQPFYIDDPAAPGARRVNFNAFTAPTAAQEAAGQFGDEPRNLLRGFAVWQVDATLHRQFPLGERAVLQFRAEAFNLFNHPIFGVIQNNLQMGPTLFGLATGTANTQLGGLNPLYQVGGPRSLQLSLRLKF